MSFLQKAYSIIVKVFNFIDDKIILNLQAIMAGIMVICMSINIVSRWTIHHSLGELDEIALIAYLYLIFIGMCRLYRTDGNIAMNFFTERLHGLPKKLLLLFDMLVIGSVSGYMTYLSYKIMMKSFNRTLNITHIPYSFTHLAFLIGFSLLALCSLFNIIRQVITIFAPQSEIPVLVTEHVPSVEGDSGSL